ncbi:MAG TPA: tetratricopeptide repeat protein [Bryobacteraceae bacterium]|nr:tetratricopeptide repeat protein [Bryobacteraceae bacterium]
MQRGAKHGWMRKRFPAVAVTALALFVVGTTGAGILYHFGARSQLLGSGYGAWFMSDDELAAHAYQLQISGNNREALKLFQEALQRDQASAYRWCDYAEALLSVGDERRARRCMERAVELGPHVGPVRMRAVNFAYRTGDAKWALEQGLKLVGIAPDYDDLIFSVWDRMDLDVATVLKAGPPDRRSAQAYFRRLLTLGRMDDAHAAWSWTLDNGFADDKLADDYAVSLIKAGTPDQGAHVWAQYAGAREPGYPDQDAVFNGGFEREPAGRGFDWQIYEVQGARAKREAGTATEGRWSLRVDFDHTQNLTYLHTTQRASVRPGVWRFEARLRTEAITTDQGVGFRVLDADSEERLQAQTERLTGTHGWTRLGTEISVGRSTKSVLVQLIRWPSWKFDNKLGGTVWVDAVSLRPLAR